MNKQEVKFTICIYTIIWFVWSQIWRSSNTKRVGDPFLPPLLLFLPLIGQTDRGRRIVTCRFMRRNAPHAACTQYELYGTPCKCVPHTPEAPHSMNHMGHNGTNIISTHSTHNRQFDMHLILCPICVILSVPRRRPQSLFFWQRRMKTSLRAAGPHESPMRE